ncbi:MAG: hypothetical protein IKL84_00130, partial [Clostridia bacterium]|nr:hypothetical protein [Clostridia bacterium]
MKPIIDQIAAQAKQHANIPFWSWNDRLEEDELGRQIENMHDLGCRGFFMHARGGLETEYMSQEWFDRIRFCVAEAKKLGMEAWAYDENGWPSGFAGGALLRDEENLAGYLTYEETDVYPAPNPDLLAVYAIRENRVYRIDAPEEGVTYGAICRHRDHSYTDIMNPVITERFLAATHEVYRAQVGEDFGGAMPGFFTDEPQYFRWQVCWSDTFLEVFEQTYGYSVLEGLPALFRDFEGAEDFRYDYYLLCHRSFINNFIKPIYDWCSAHGVKLTGHAVEEWSLDGQMMCCGGVMPFYLYEHIPGIDYLGRNYKNSFGARQLGSVCAQTGRREALSEMFACCGWDVTPRELKRIADLQFVAGVNMICDHLYPYSERGQRKRDYPCHYSPHNPWQADQREFHLYFARLGAALSLGEEIADTLVLHPIRTAYLSYKKMTRGSLLEQDQALYRTVEQLDSHNLAYHWGDETILRMMGSVEGAQLRVGECRYDKIVIPNCRTIDSSTAELLKAYLAGGGKLLILGDAPDRIDGHAADTSFLHSTMTWEELVASAPLQIEYTRAPDTRPIMTQIRRVEGKKLIYVTNPSAAAYPNVEITVRDSRGFVEIDPLTLETRPVRGRRNPDGSVTLLCDIGDSGACLLCETEEEMLPMQPTPPVTGFIPLTMPFTLAERPENALTLDRASLSLDGAPFSEERPIEQIRDNLLYTHFSGRAVLRYAFEVRDIPQKLLLVAEPIRGMEVSLNGTPLTAADTYRIDPRFKAYDLAGLVRAGQNAVCVAFDYAQSPIVYEALYGGGTETIRNSLAFDTELEAVYLFGDFTVRTGGITDGERGSLRASGPFALTAPADEIDLTDIVRSGYPFFAGRLCAEGIYRY